MWKGFLPASAVTKNPDGVSVAVSYVLTDGAQQILGNFTNVYDVDAIPQLVQKQADDLNFRDAQKAKVIAVDPTVIVGPVDDLLPKPDPDIAAKRAFQQLLYDYKAAVAGELHGLAVSMPSSDRWSLVDKAYKPEYEPMLAVLTV